MKIPKRVNSARDWAEKNIRTIVIVAVLVISGGLALLLPTLGAFVFGVAVGSAAFFIGASGRLRRFPSGRQ